LEHSPLLLLFINKNRIVNIDIFKKLNFYAAKAKRDQDIAEGIASLVNEIFTVNPKKRAKRKAKRAKRKSRARGL
jgi:hypothetical protein